MQESSLISHTCCKQQAAGIIDDSLPCLKYEPCRIPARYLVTRPRTQPTPISALRCCVALQCCDLLAAQHFAVPPGTRLHAIACERARRRGNKLWGFGPVLLALHYCWGQKNRTRVTHCVQSWRVGSPSALIFRACGASRGFNHQRSPDLGAISYFLMLLVVN